MKNKKKHEGLSAKTTDKKEVVRIAPEDVEIMPKEEEELTLERIEEQLVKIEKDRTWLERLLVTGKGGQEVRDIEDASDKLKARIEFRQRIVDLMEQNVAAKERLLDLQVKSKEKELLMDPETQKANLELQRRDVNMRILQRKLRESQLQKQIDELEDSSQKTEKEETEEESCDLKDFEELKEKPTSKDDTP